MRDHRGPSIAALSLVLAVLGALAAGPPPAQAATELEVALRTSGQLVSPPGSEAPGFDVELLERFVAWYRVRENQELELVTTRVETVPELLEVMREGRFDIGLGGITITDERQAIVDFSQPYLPVRSVLVARAGVLPAQGYRAQLPGKRVAAITGSTNALLVEELSRQVEGVRPELAYGTNEELFAALTSARPTLDAAVVDVTHFWTLGREGNVVLVDQLGPAQGLGFVLPRGSAWKAPLDAFITEFKRSSSYFHLIRRYFGQDAEEMVRMAR